MKRDRREPLPSYDALPIANDKPPGSSWGLWGEDDFLGCLNLIDEEATRTGAACVRRGAVFALNWGLEYPDPPFQGRAPFRHEVRDLRHEAGHDDHLDDWNPQSSSQWDGFRHMRSQWGYYNGLPDAEHGVHHWARKGIATRGVLADVARWRAATGRPLTPDATEHITPDDLLGCLASEGVEVARGDVLLVRTGYTAWYQSLDAAGREAASQHLAYCGLEPGETMARTLWDLHLAAIAADNLSVEAMPPRGASYRDTFELAVRDTRAAIDHFVHFSLIPLLGLPMGELWDMEALAEDCAADGVYTFFLTSAPLNLKAGVASPANALAIK